MSIDMKKIVYSGIADIGYGRTVNEDYMQVAPLDEYVILAIIADGTASHNNELQPAMIVVNEIKSYITQMYKYPSFFTENTKDILKDAILSANRIIAAFKMGNDEFFSGYAASVTAVVIDSRNNNLSFAHCGNTRLYLVRDKVGKDIAPIPTIRQLTKDHTKAQLLVDNGTILDTDYYFHPCRLEMTSGVGIVTNPMIQTFSADIQNRDLFLMSTDGIHYAIKQDALCNIICQSNNCDIGVNQLVQMAKELKNIDNMSAIILFNGEQKEKDEYSSAHRSHDK